MRNRLLIALALLTVAAAPAVAAGGDSDAPTASQQKRLPIPDAQARQQARQRIQGIFEVPKAKTQAAKKALAARMLNVGKQTKNDAAARFVLFNMSRKLALQAEDLDVALAATAELDVFQIDRLKLEARTRYAAIKWNLPAAEEAAVANKVLTWIDGAVVANRLDLAAPLVESLFRKSRGLRDAALRKRIVDGRRRVEELSRRWAEAKPAVDTLQVDPDDTEANLKYGRYLCFAVGDWARGLPHLAQGSDAALKELAQRDLAGPREAKVQVKLAENWCEIADSQKDYEPCNQRAAHWLRKAHGQLTGFNRLTVENRLKELGLPLQPQAEDVAASASRSEPPAASPKADPQEPEEKPEAPVAAFMAPDQSDRLTPVNTGDGKFAQEMVFNVPVLVAGKNYLYFRVDDEFLNELPGDKPVLVRVTALDTKRQTIDIEYDGHVTDASIQNEGRYRATKSHGMTGSGRLRHFDFVLPFPRLANRQNYGSDFRIRARARGGATQLAVHRVQVRAVPSQ